MKKITPPIVRFAPSPTGFLHIGGARTALFNFLFARHHNGQFVLRVEDTDRERSTPEAVEAILDGLSWLGLDWDRGPEFQSQRGDLYQEKLDSLLEKGKAYRCYCTPEELETMRAQQRATKAPLKYNGRCRKHQGKEIDKPHTIRFLVPPGRTTVRDVIKGDVTYQHEEIEDLVIARSDKSPTYNFVVVVDDVDMGITHVIRGDDHLNNTPKQILLYEALGFSVPQFAHLPLILGEDRQRLSKRHGATSVQAYREMGYLPHAVVNYLARLGWSHGDQEVFSLAELIEKFDLDTVGKSAGVFNPQKLMWLNQHYIKEASFEELLVGIRPFVQVSPERTGECAERMLNALRERSKTLEEMARRARFYFLDDIEYDAKAVGKFLSESAQEPLEKLRVVLSECSPFVEDVLKPRFEALVAELGLKMKNLAQPLRVALTGGTESPSIYEVLQILGPERVLARIDAALEKIKNGESV